MAVVAAMGLAAQVYGQDGLLIDANTAIAFPPDQATGWTPSGVTENISSAAIGSVDNAGNVTNISNLSISVGPNGGQFSAGTFPGVTMINGYVYGSSVDGFDVSLGGFDDGTGTATALTTNTDLYGAGNNGNSFTLQANFNYKLYLFGAGAADGQGTTFTLDGLSKATSDIIEGTDPDAGHLVTFTVQTPTDLTGYTIDFNAANNAGSSSDFYTWNGAALIPISPVPEPSAFGLILGGFAFAFE